MQILFESDEMIDIFQGQSLFYSIILFLFISNLFRFHLLHLQIFYHSTDKDVYIFI